MDEKLYKIVAVRFIWNKNLANMVLMKIEKSNFENVPNLISKVALVSPGCFLANLDSDDIEILSCLKVSNFTSLLFLMLINIIKFVK